MNTPIYVISAQADRSAEHLETIWDALHDYREVCIPEGKDESFDEIWDDITFAMEELRVALGLPDPVEADNPPPPHFDSIAITGGNMDAPL